MSTGARQLPAVVIAACLAVLCTGCASVSDGALESSLPTRQSRSAVAKTPSGSISSGQCGDVTASLRPAARLPSPGHMPKGSFMRAIQDRGRLIAGVDQNTLRFAYLNPFTGQLEGFEIDLVRRIARAVLGDPHAIEFIVITSAQRIDAIQRRRVDIVADAMTITCDRRRAVAFTTPYYDAGQRLLVSSDSTAKSIRDLAGKRVCATTTSTSIQHIESAGVGMIPYAVSQRTDCLVALQQGEVDAISTDDAILLGFHAQDPYTKIVGPRFWDEPYGMAIDKSHPDFVRFVNGVLAQMTSDGTWSSIHHRWLSGLTHGRASRPPAAHYRG
jgi:polar amino acid transport system substrate-binding protein